MYGIEWEQPAIVAMALAQGAVHKDDLRDIIFTAEDAARKSAEPMPEIARLFEDVAADEKLATAARPSESSTTHDVTREGVVARASDAFLRIVSKVKVGPEELEARTVEMYNTVIYQTAGAALRPGKEPRFDFFLMSVLSFFLSLSFPLPP